MIEVKQIDSAAGENERQISESGTAQRRRLLFGTLVLITVLLLTALMVVTLSRGGFGALDWVLTICFLVTLPWTVIGFWNAVIGLLVTRSSADPTGAVYPRVASREDNSPINAHTALLLCIRNEDVSPVARNLDLMVDQLVATGAADRFHVYVLSDSTWDDLIAGEEQTFGALEDRWRGILPVTYRRRDRNLGFKAGNIRDFCNRWGHLHDFALVLDADSLMAAKSIGRMVRTMQQNPRLGILQGLIVGMPTVSPFARVFQFGMRLGMRSYTLGSAWWQGDSGPYWGHNALIRLAPFIEHCKLPRLPGRPPLGGWILSHDQVEAALMRRAGWEVRVLPEEDGSWEENPPTLLEFIRRDLRWCQGNMQYLRLLRMPGLEPVSRIQLALAVLMFVGSPAWIAFMSLGILRVGLAEDPTQTFHPETGLMLFGIVMTMVFAPKIATMIEMLASAGRSHLFGGRLSILSSFFGELLFSILLAPIMALAHTKFLVGLLFGRVAVWSEQRRGSHRVHLREGFRRLWPQTLYGLTLFGWLALAAPGVLIGFTPFLLGPILSVPFASLTSSRRLGSLLARLGLWRIPEETAPPVEIRALHLPALGPARAPLATAEPAAGTLTGE